MAIRPVCEAAVIRYVEHYFPMAGFSPRVSLGYRLMVSTGLDLIFHHPETSGTTPALPVESIKYKVYLLGLSLQRSRPTDGA